MSKEPSTSDPARSSFADSGQARIEWADSQMPVLAEVRERFAREQPLGGVSVAACLHVTAETANLVRALIAGGAQVGLCAANPLSTQDDVAAALAERYGAAVLAERGESAESYAEHVTTLVAGGPQVTIDDGADLIAAIHESDPSHATTMLGGTEETTAGLLRVRALADEGTLACPVLAVNESRTERAFNDRFGTGQSTIDGILRATNLLLAGRTVVVLGYGWTGRGIALRARGAGASVIVCEVDPLRALEARMEGYEVMGALAAAARGDVFVTVTGGRDVLRGEHFECMKDGALLANAGHFDVELKLEDLRALAVGGRREALPLVEEHTLADGRRLNLLAQGRVVNLAAGEGHPAAVMDMSFAGQALCVEYLAAGAGRLPAGVLAVPEQIDEEVARLKLASLGVQIDELREDQRVYRSSWEWGTSPPG
ncbi:MAG TPA: adenosylhomocysteinase [Solirubrobacteraceae bacterium]|jgi:adenosylhomocysteinase|nr:adenosylhomocysteinase [Solirubrobacteraceae bacterium]